MSDELLTFSQWKERGLVPNKGSKMVGRNKKGFAVFSWSQVVPLRKTKKSPLTIKTHGKQLFFDFEEYPELCPEEQQNLY